MPRVSVLMPVFNGEQFLLAAIESILGQGFTGFEMIVVDDGSTDNTPEILRSIRDSRLRLLRNERNLGIVAALNRGLEYASGEYICRMDADDIALPGRLEQQVSFLDANPKCVLVGTHARLIDDRGNEIGVEAPPASDAHIRRIMFVHNPFIHGSVMLRSSALRAVGRYDDRFLHNEDYDLWLRIASLHSVANLPEILVSRRIHGNAITVAHELELVRYRIRTLRHAILHYYRKPAYLVHVVRPVLAYAYRRIRKALRSTSLPFVV